MVKILRLTCMISILILIASSPYSYADSVGNSYDPRNRVGGLTDEEVELQNHYRNTAYEDRLYDQACKSKGDSDGKNGAYCSTSSSGTSEERTVETICQTAEQALSSISMMLGIFGMSKNNSSSSSTTKDSTDSVADKATDKAKVESKEAKEMKEKKESGYCKAANMGPGLIAQAFTMVATTMQKMQEQTISAELNTSTPGKNFDQIESLYKMQRAYETREKTIELELSGWSIATVLWAGLAVYCHDGMTAVLAAGGAALITCYGIKLSMVKDAIKKIKNIIDEFNKLTGDGKNNCNPIAQRNCYCSQPETKNDQKYCLPVELQNRTVANGVPISCVNNNNENDPTCKCLSNDTCADKLFQQFPSELQMNANSLMGADISPLKNMLRGQYNQSGVARALNGVSKAIKGAMANIHPPETGPLSSAQRSRADALKNNVIPSEWAAYLASKPASNSDLEKARRGLSSLKSDLASLDKNSLFNNAGKAGGSAAYRRSGDSKVLTFESGRGASRSSASSSGGSDDDFLNKMKEKLMGKKGQGAAGMDSKVLDFGSNSAADQATRAAQINKNTSKGIFEILSHRYKTSAWLRFGVIDQ
ncbi:MAG: hypothetical protein HQK51_09495 [Oligoflexia bacterium]|nr:hypothetical protein [Oligoflexia bacterium]